jgi:2-polyprenyl-3-methyl-5-hydroxy-6-metoxy-1,4-benzoquinol methylase
MEVECIACSSPRHVSVLRKPEQAHDRDVVVVRCLDCDLSFLADWKSEVDIHLYDYYAERLQATKQERYRPLNTKRQREVLHRIGAHCQGRRLLDVGCGEGHLVHTAIEEGWIARGIDFSAPAIAMCKAFDVPCDLTDFLAPELDEAQFDAIIMSELIEHVPEPGRYLARAEQLLAPGGVLYLTTPNFNSLTRRLIGEKWRAIGREHISYFTTRSLKGLIERCTSMRALSISTRNVSVQEIKQALTRGARQLVGLRLASSPALPSPTSRDQVLREQIERFQSLKVVKRAVNRALHLSGLGNTLVALCQKATTP